MKFFLTSLVILCFATHANARIAKIISTKQREASLKEIELLLNYKDEELKSSIPYTLNPFYFEQPLILKLRAPGGLKDEDLITSLGKMIAADVSGAFIRGNRRSLLMKNGTLIKEGDEITKKLADFGNVETTAIILKIDQAQFTLKLNNTIRDIDLSSAE